jgi:hypothetical protein
MHLDGRTAILNEKTSLKTYREVLVTEHAGVWEFFLLLSCRTFTYFFLKILINHFYFLSSSEKINENSTLHVRTAHVVIVIVRIRTYRLHEYM